MKYNIHEMLFSPWRRIVVTGRLRTSWNWFKIQRYYGGNGGVMGPIVIVKDAIIVVVRSQLNYITKLFKQS